jgi:hypothetical protein
VLLLLIAETRRCCSRTRCSRYRKGWGWGGARREEEEEEGGERERGGGAGLLAAVDQGVVWLLERGFVRVANATSACESDERAGGAGGGVTLRGGSGGRETGGEPQRGGEVLQTLGIETVSAGHDRQRGLGGVTLCGGGGKGLEATELGIATVSAGLSPC